MLSHDLCTSQLLFRLFFFQLFPIICNINLAPPLQLHMHNTVYTVSGHSHTLDMAIHEHSIRTSRPVGRDVTSIVAALHASWPVDVQCGVCVL